LKLLSNETIGQKENKKETKKRKKTFLNCCFTVHFDKYKIILPTNALFIKNIK
jgi:hypothetical protein